MEREDEGDEKRKDDDINREQSTVRAVSRRRYKYVNRRSAAPKNLAKRTVKWLTDLDVFTGPTLRRTACCKQLKCIRRVLFDHFISHGRSIFSLSVFSRNT